ncbi:MAG: cytochrome c1 [Gammaproteobacteria bacterium]|nr:cytochrome c1 [Gammaproteobacteria bacterium]
MKKILFILSVTLLCGPLYSLAQASEDEAYVAKADINLENKDSLRRGARLFVNYCLSCHSAAYLRYKRVADDLDIDEKLAAEKLIFVADFSKMDESEAKRQGEPKKIGALMTVAMRAADSKRWFGTAVPDLSVIARSRGADWLYTYLTTFYVDDTRPMGVNNLAFHNVGMPHVLWELDGLKKPIYETVKNKQSGTETETQVFTGKFDYLTEGKLSPVKYKEAVNDLVNFLVYMGEPGRLERQRIGIIVVLFLGLLLLFAYLMKREFWKDVH